MMVRLKDMTGNSDALANGLQQCGKSHRRYNLYMPMERALGLLLNGNLYLSNGANWNDKHDRDAMSAKRAYAVCMSYATVENVAMWMLYGGNGGKQGAMISFLPSTINEILNVDHIELGKFGDDGLFVTSSEDTIDINGFRIFISDMLYTEICNEKDKQKQGDNVKDNEKNKNNEKMRKITHADEHVTVGKEIIDHDDIFNKDIAWQYEKECRLIVKLSSEWATRANEKSLDFVRVVLSDKALRELRKGRLTRSPLYYKGTDYGKPSKLTGSVLWE